MGDCKEGGSLTEKQHEEVLYLTNKVRTAKQDIRLNELIAKRDFKPEFDLSEGAKSFTRKLVKSMVYGYTPYFTSKETQKGTLVEDDSILLYNSVFGTCHAKNTERKRNEWIDGECDINAVEFNLVIDIKSSWSKETFPTLPDEIDVSGYEDQLRGYMMLYDLDRAELAFCLVNTPYHLLKYEANVQLHYVDDVEKELRVTSLFFNRCLDYEEKIKHKVSEVRKYAKWYENKLIEKYEKNCHAV